MRTFLTILLMTFISVSMNAQIIGGFDIGQDGHIYFNCINNSGYNYSIQLIAKSSDRTNTEYKSIANGTGLMLGPSTPWRWYFKKGDIVQIVFANGQYQYWTCPQNDAIYNNPSFKGKVKSSCHIRGHNCSGGIDTNNDGWCDICYGNGYKCHMVTHQPK